MPNVSIEQKFAQLEQKVKQISQLLAIHQHSNDGTNPLRKNIALDRDQWVSIGPSQQITDVQALGTFAEQYGYYLSLGGDTLTNGFVNKSINMQMTFRHRPNQTISDITAFRSPVASNTGGSTVSVSSGGSTITIPGFNFTANQLTGALINIYNSLGTFVESRAISSNTATVVTITGTWGASTSNATFLIYVPVFLGSSDIIFNRVYVQEGTSVGGVRFGTGPTTAGQAGLLYMDAAGDLYWRNKAGASTKLN